MSVSVTYIVTQSMDKRAYSFKSSATYRAGGHFKEKQALSLASQKIMVGDEGYFQASFPDLCPVPESLTHRHRIRLGIPGKPLLSIGDNASSISPSGARLLAAGTLLMTISKVKTPFSQVCIAFMSIIRRGVCLWS